jgi:hypothetical protein
VYDLLEDLLKIHMFMREFEWFIQLSDWNYLLQNCQGTGRVKGACLLPPMLACAGAVLVRSPLMSGAAGSLRHSVLLLGMHTLRLLYVSTTTPLYKSIL